LSYTKILGQLQDAGNHYNFVAYLNLLDTAGLLAGIEKIFARHCPSRRKSKFLVHNTALAAALHNSTYKTITRQPEAWGRIVNSNGRPAKQVYHRRISCTILAQQGRRNRFRT